MKCPEDNSMDGVNFHSLFQFKKDPTWRVAFASDVPFRNMGSTAQALYYQSRDVLQHFLNYKVIPACEPKLLESVQGKWFDVCLHDMVGQDEVDYTVLGFSKKRDDQTNILVPDLYAMQGYFGALNEPDPFCWNHKIDEFFFIGNYTGDGRPKHNKRAQLCRWAVDVPWCHAYLSEIHQVPIQTMFEYDPGYERYMHTPLPKKYQKMYRHLLSVDGNTAAWDRPAWIMASNSVLWKQESDHITWWSDLCHEGVHYVGFRDVSELETKWKSGIHFRNIIENAQNFVKDHLTEDGHVKRWLKLIEEWV
jgi:hypothetical protein